MSASLKRYVAEMIGTFMLVFAITGAAVVDTVTNGTVTHVGMAINSGLIVTVVIYSLGHVSGAHLNPAITLAFALVNRFPKRDIVPYILAQLLGAFLASFALRLLFSNAGTLGATIVYNGNFMQSLVLEIITTFFLMTIIVGVATDWRAQSQFAGLAIGATVLLSTMFAGPISGASLNPARSIAPAVVSGVSEHQWVYILGPILGAAMAALIYEYLREEKR